MKKPTVCCRFEGAELVEVICTKRIIGHGTDSDPKRRLTSYWSKDGLLLAEHDEMGDQPTETTR